MLAMRDVAELVGDDLRLADLRINIAMRVTIDPIVDIRICDIIAQLHSKCAIDSAVTELLGCTLLRRHMVREYNLRFRIAFLHSRRDKIETTIVFGIEIVGGETMSVVQDSEEITHAFLRPVCVKRLDKRPKRRNDNIHVADRNDPIVIRMYVVTDLLAIAIRHG